jgi:hypothetical protein
VWQRNSAGLSGPFDREQASLDGNPSLGGVSAEIARRRYDPMAGDHQRDGVSGHAVAHCPSGPRRPGLGGQLAVGEGRSERNSSAAADDFGLKPRQWAWIDGNILKVVGLALQVGHEPIDQRLVPRARPERLGHVGSDGLDGLFPGGMPKGQPRQDVASADERHPPEGTRKHGKPVGGIRSGHVGWLRGLGDVSRGEKRLRMPDRFDSLGPTVLY